MEAYGLSSGDPAKCERWENWLSWSPIARVTIAGGGGFLLMNFISGNDAAAGLASSIGAFVSVTDIGDRLEESAIAALLPKLVQYRKFRVARAEFESTRMEAEHQEVRRRSEFWLTLPGHAFERELATLLERGGYEVRRTPGSGDGGIDLVLRQSGRNHRRAVQADEAAGWPRRRPGPLRRADSLRCTRGNSRHNGRRDLGCSRVLQGKAAARHGPDRDPHARRVHTRWLILYRAALQF